MPVTAVTVTNTSSDWIIAKWLAVPNGNTGAPLGDAYADFSDRSVSVGGTFGAGGSVSIKGCIDGTNYIVLTDPQGNNITKTAAAIEQIMEGTPFIRPEVTAGDGTTAID